MEVVSVTVARIRYLVDRFTFAPVDPATFVSRIADQGGPEC